ncbi:MAG: nucleotide exchange factor GrpE [Halanaeroarchaeum sp.]
MTKPEQNGDDASGEATDAERDTDAEGADHSEDATVASLRDEQLEDVREADDESLADELAGLKLTVENLQAELDEKDEEIADLTTRLKRKQADFQNFKKRMERRREEEKQRATEQLVERLLDVRDNLKRALEQADTEALRDGVESTFRQFERELERENVEPIEPVPGDDVDPTRHEVLARIEAEVPEGAIADVHRPGYEMAERVLRPAQVAVSDGADDDDTGAETSDSVDGSDGTDDDDIGVETSDSVDGTPAEEAPGSDTASEPADEQ